MKQPEYRNGAEARKNFEDGMRKLFRVPKSAVTKKPEPKTKAPAKEESEN
jgi:hypothetical protein